MSNEDKVGSSFRLFPLETRKEETLTPFRHFMTQQYSKYLKTEIDNYTTSTNKSL